MKKDKYIFKIICISIGLTLIVRWISLIFQDSNFCLAGTVDGWLGFYGGLIGGAITMVGVREQINSDNEQRKNDLAIQYRPIITIKSIQETGKKPNKLYDAHIFLINKEENELITQIEKDSDQVKSIYYLLFDIENIGRGEATNISIDFSADDTTSVYNKAKTEWDEYNKNNKLSLLPVNLPLNNIIYFTDLDKYEPNKKEFSLTLNMKYADFNNTNEYLFSCVFMFEHKLNNEIYYKGYNILENNKKQ